MLILRQDKLTWAPAVDMSSKYGIGLRPVHYADIIKTKPTIDFFEILTEDFIHLRGDDCDWLEKIRAGYPVAMHGVSLSIGSTDPLNKNYLNALKKFMHHVNPISVSDHFCWTGVNKINTHDLLPLPFTQEVVDHVVSRIQQVQDFLGRQIMLENVSSYVTFSNPDMTEWEFIAEIAKRADCFILLDVNNIYVNAFNHGFSAEDYVQAMPVDRVKQFHLSGHQHCGTHIIDTHDDNIVDAVWDLYAKAVQRFPNASLIIERDAQIPPLGELIDELNRARKTKASRRTEEHHDRPESCNRPKNRSTLVHGHQ